MRAVVQRVDWARVSVEGQVVGQIDQGLLVLLGAGQGDTERDVEYLANKVAHLRIFEDQQRNMNRSVLDQGGGVLLVSQFTLYGDARKGRRPSFAGALEPVAAEQLCDLMLSRLQALGVSVASGRFRARMEVESCNAGPVTILLDSSRAF